MDARTHVQTTITLLTAARTDLAILEDLLDEIDLKDYVRTQFIEMAVQIPLMASGEFDVDGAGEVMKSGKFDEAMAAMALQLASED